MTLGRTGLLLAAGLLSWGRMGRAATQVNFGGGSQAFSLLDQPAGARALAMGSAYEAVADDSSGLLWNPAAPGLAPGLEVGVNHETWLAGTSRDVLSLQSPLLPWLSAGAFGGLVSYPNMTLRDGSGAVVGTDTPQDQGYGLGLAIHQGGLVMGLSGRYLSEQLPGYFDSRLAGTLGALWSPWTPLGLALVLQTVPQYDVSLKPQEICGVSLKGVSAGWHWTGASSVRLASGDQSELDLGLELATGSSIPLAFRGGISSLFPDSGSTTDQRPSFGFGLGYQRLQLDYAYLPWGDFGATHRLSLSWHQAWIEPAPEAHVAPMVPRAVPTATPAVRSPSPAVAVTAPPASATAQTTLHVLSDLAAQGRAFQAQGLNLEALRAYRMAVDANNADMEAWRGLARVYGSLGRLDYARSCWRQVLVLDSQDQEAVEHLAVP